MRLTIGFAVLLTATLTAGPAYPPPQFADPDRVAKLQSAMPEIDRLFRAYATDKKIPGMVWGVVIDGRLAHIGIVRRPRPRHASARHGGHRVPHRVDDQELHGAGDSEAARRRPAVAGRSGVEMDSGIRAHGTAHARHAAADAFVSC